MGEFRNSDDLVTVITELRAKVADMESTLMMRTSRRPTGDIEPTLLKTAKPNTLFLQGQSVFRTDHPVLWQYALDNDLVGTGLFGAGDGVNNFVLPNFTGRTIIGAGGSNLVGADVGADAKSITIANLPAHAHRYSDPGLGYADYAGGHGGHENGRLFNIGGGGTGEALLWPARTQADHWHPIIQGFAGGDVAFNVQQASKAVNWMIYT